MKSFVQRNSTYFYLLFLSLAAGGALLVYFDKPNDLLFFSDNRTPFYNLFFRYGTKLGEEPIYVLAGLILLASRVRHALLIALTGLSVTVISVSLKAFFAMDRPIAYLQKNGLEETIELVEGVDLHSAATSFPSGHAMSGFALYSLLIFLLPNRKRYVLPLFFMAIVVAVSRVYLVQHFWEDIYVGSIIGALIAMAAMFIDHRFNDKLDEPLFNLMKP